MAYFEKGQLISPKVDGFLVGLVSSILLLPLLFLGSCSDDDEIERMPWENTVSYFVSSRLEDGNANMPSGGVVTSQYPDSPFGNDIDKLVDGNVNTDFIIQQSHFYVLWHGNRKVAVDSYTLTSANDTEESDPKSWSLFGSNDNMEWTLLDEQAEVFFSTRQETRTFEFTNETAYKYYKLNVTANGSGKSTHIAEWTMHSSVESPNPLSPYTVEVKGNNVNMPCAGSITSEFSDFPEGRDVGKLVDDNAGTIFATGHDRFYILWKGKYAKNINTYSLVSSGSNPENDPQAWTLYGSIDGEEWIILDKQEKQVFVNRQEKHTYRFTNEMQFSYYKLNIESNNGGAETWLAEWAMGTIPTSIDDLMKFVNSYNDVPETPMGWHFGHEGYALPATTKEGLDWLADATMEPKIPEGIENCTMKEFTVSTLYPSGEPTPADVNQHAIGNCAMLAVFASWAYSYPNFIKNIIHTNNDNTYSVEMFDPMGEPIMVNMSNKFFTDANGDILGVTGKSELTWATVLEKAMMKYNNIYPLVGDDYGGVLPHMAVPLFAGTGDSFDFEHGALTGEQMERVAQVCLNQGKIVYAEFDESGWDIDGLNSVAAHGFSVMLPATPGVLFCLRNPWGFNTTYPDGYGATDRDGLMNVYNNMSSHVRMRVLEPGKAAQYGSGVFEPYRPAPLTRSTFKIRLAPWLLNPGR